MDRREMGARYPSYGDGEYAKFSQRSFNRHLGFDRADLEKPIIGICNTFSEINRCHAHFGPLVQAIKRGVLMAGGIPMEFPTISLGEPFTSPTAMMYRNLAAMDTEEMIRAQPIDGVVLVGGCDKTIPAQLMGAASADVPAILVSGGPMMNGEYEGERLGACTDCRRFWQEYRAGTIDDVQLELISEALCPTAGHCVVMGTASTMACCAEAMGMMLPSGAAYPAPDVRRLRVAEESGRRIVDLVAKGVRPSHIITWKSLENAVRVLMAIGGSTNAVIHLIAVARRVGVDLTMDDFDRIGRETPVLANLRPTGKYQMEEFARAGGVPAVMKHLEAMLHKDCLTVSGRTVGEILKDVRISPVYRDVIRPLDDPVYPEGGIAVLRGSLAPEGAVIKPGAASPHLLRHRGRAVVFDSIADLERRIDDPDLVVNEGDILVLRNAGPVGAPGMPEAGLIPIPKKLLARGVRDMVRISDCRMSGTAAGTVVLHVSPEAAVGGPLALVATGDEIELDVPARRLDLLVPEEELQRRGRRGGRRPGSTGEDTGCCSSSTSFRPTRGATSTSLPCRKTSSKQAARLKTFR